MLTNIQAVGLDCTEPLALLLQEDEHRLCALEADLLVLGPLARSRAARLRQLRYRKSRRTPFAILPAESFAHGMISVPYITYGLAESAHVRAGQVGERFLVVHTPLGELTIELRSGWSVDDCLAAVALGLALRLAPDTIARRLSSSPDLALAA